MNKIPLFEEYRLIERTELEINGAWRGIIASLPHNFCHGSNTHHTNSSSVKKRLRKLSGSWNPLSGSGRFSYAEEIS